MAATLSLFDFSNGFSEVMAVSNWLESPGKVAEGVGAMEVGADLMGVSTTGFDVGGVEVGTGFRYWRSKGLEVDWPYVNATKPMKSASNLILSMGAKVVLNVEC